MLDSPNKFSGRDEDGPKVLQKGFESPLTKHRTFRTPNNSIGSTSDNNAPTFHNSNTTGTSNNAAEFTAFRNAAVTSNKVPENFAAFTSAAELATFASLKSHNSNNNKATVRGGSLHSSPRHQSLLRVVGASDRTSPRMMRKGSIPSQLPDGVRERLAAHDDEYHFSLKKNPQNPGYHNPYLKCRSVKKPDSVNVIFGDNGENTSNKNSQSYNHLNVPNKVVNGNRTKNSHHTTINDLSKKSEKSRIPYKISNINCSPGNNKVNNNDNKEYVQNSRMLSPKVKLLDKNIEFDNEFGQQSFEYSHECKPGSNIFNFDSIEDSINSKTEFDANSAERSNVFDMNHSNSLGLNEWSSGKSSSTNPSNSSWNSGASDEKMSIDEKSSATTSSSSSSKQSSSTISSRPRTYSLGSSSGLRRPASSEVMGGSLEGVENMSETDSGLVDSVSSKMVLIKCKDGNYLTRIFIGNEGESS